MANIIYLAPVIVVIVISIVVVKIATVALRMTGMDAKKARFQAVSAFTGTGFTTKDSELVLEDDIRKKVIMALMILGNAGLITVITSLILSFGKGGIQPVLTNSSILILSVLVIYKLTTFKRLTSFLTRKIETRLEQGTMFQKRPVEEVMRIAKNYGIAEVHIKSNNQNLGKTLIDSSFRKNDILVLAIERTDGVIPAPKATDIIQLGDTLICYGKLKNIAKIV